MMDDLHAALEERLGHRFADPTRLLVAVTHRSYRPGAANNETLEFLGDAVLALAVSELLMCRFPGVREGDLSKRRAALVNAASLARKAEALGLGRWLRLGKGEERSGGRAKAKILAGAYEAVLGALHLDGGYEAARNAVAREFADDLAACAGPAAEDFKTRLQELTQQRFREAPTYTLVEERGPDHAKQFVAELALGGRPLARGEGRTKKAAEQAAARRALERLTGHASERT